MADLKYWVLSIIFGALVLLCVWEVAKITEGNRTMVVLPTTQDSAVDWDYGRDEWKIR